MMSQSALQAWSSSLTDRIVRRRLPLALVGLVLFALAYPASFRLEFDRSIGAMFRPSDRTFLEYKELQQLFGGNSVVVLVYRDAALATSEGIARNRVIASEVAQVTGVEGVLSPAKLSDAVKKFQPSSLLSNDPALFREGDPVASGFDELFAGYTHAQDHSSGAVVAMLDPSHPPETVRQLSSIAQDLPNRFTESDSGSSPIESAAIVGEAVLVHDGFALIERDGARLATLTVALLSVVVVLSLADIRFVLLTAVVIGWSVVLTKGIMVILGIHLSLVSTILTAIVTVITVTAVLHLGVRFRGLRARGYEQVDATGASMRRLIAPIFWTCATDAAGFAALYASRILPIRQFGLMIAIASLAVFLAIVLFGPTLMMLPGTRIGAVLHQMQRRLARELRRRTLRIAHASVQNFAWCCGIVAILVVIAAIGIGRAETETSFLNNFRPTSSVVRAYQSVENEFGGAGVWDVILEAPSEITDEYLDQVRMLEDELRQIEVEGARLTKVLSLADAEEVAARAPLSSVFSSSSRLSAMSLVMPVFFEALLTRTDSGDQRHLRIMLRSREQLNAPQKTALIKEVQRCVDRRVQSEDWKRVVGTESTGRVTGYYVLMARLVSQLVGDQWRCFLVSGVMVWALLVIATRSLRLATVALLPNLLPVFLVLALVGIFGGRINMGAAMIAAVSIGLSIDGSVHFLDGYRRFRRRGHDAPTAATHSAANMGVAVLLATVALIVGFGALSTSEFVPTATFGTLVAATLALGTAVNLTILPAMIGRTGT